MAKRKITTEKAPVKQSQKYNLASPEDINKFSNILKKFIVEAKLSCNIKGKEYVYVDGWKFAGLSFGLTAIPKRPENLSTEKEIKYSCECEIIRIDTKEVIGYGFAICSNKEEKKRHFDEYAIASMAQTRAQGKGFRNLLGFVMNMAGFEATPAEEMTDTKTTQEPVELEQELADEILLFTSADELRQWANELKEYHKNKAFIQAVRKQLAQLEK
jgi:hypothetical protein